MNVLITGAAGYIGSELLYRLAANRKVDKIILYDNFSKANYNLFVGWRKLPKGKIKVVEADILDARTLSKNMEEADVVYHLAAKVKTPFTDEDPHGFEQVNNWGVAQLTDVLEKSSEVKKLIHISSISVYGANHEKKTVTQPKTAYGISKLRGEKHLNRLKHKMEVYILRLGNVFGYSKNLRIDAVVNKMMFNAHFHRLIQIHGSGEQKRAFLSIEAALDVFEHLLEENFFQKTLNVVEYNMSINQVVENVRQIYPDLEMIYVNQDLKMRSIEVQPSEEIQKFISPVDFKTRLQSFKEAFTF